MNNIVKQIESLQKKKTVPTFKVGDTICVSFNIIYNNKKKNQLIEGVVLGIYNKNLRTKCLIRKNSFGENVEKKFFLYSPIVNWIKVKKRGLIKQSKPYYIRHTKSKSLQIKENSKKRRGA